MDKYIKYDAQPGVVLYIEKISRRILVTSVVS